MYCNSFYIFSASNTLLLTMLKAYDVCSLLHYRMLKIFFSMNHNLCSFPSLLCLKGFKVKKENAQELIKSNSIIFTIRSIRFRTSDLGSANSVGDGIVKLPNHSSIILCFFLSSDNKQIPLQAVLPASSSDPS